MKSQTPGVFRQTITGILVALMALPLNAPLIIHAQSTVPIFLVNNGDPNRSVVTNISFTLPTNQVLAPSGVTLQSLSSDFTINSSNLLLSVQALSNKHDILFLDLPGGSVPDGNYFLSVVAAPATNPAGPRSSASLPFHRYFGDHDGDRDVDFFDAWHLREAWSEDSNSWRFDATMDSNADGRIDEADLSPFGSNYFTVLRPHPAIFAHLVSDDGEDTDDGVVTNPEIAGTIVMTNAAARLEAALRAQGTGSAAYVDVTASLMDGANFTFDPNQLAGVHGSHLTNGSYQLDLRLVETSSLVSAAFSLRFDLGESSYCPFPDLEDWHVLIATNLLPAGVPGTVSLDDCEAVMAEGDSFSVQMSRILQVPDNPSLLVVSYAPAFDAAVEARMNDAFEVALVDEAGKPLTFTIQGAAGITPASVAALEILPAKPDACFNHSHGSAPFFAPGTALSPPSANSESTTLSIDISHLEPGSTATLILRLVNNDRDRGSIVRITDVAFSPADPSLNLGGSPGAALSLLGAAPARNLGESTNSGRLDFNTPRSLSTGKDFPALPGHPLVALNSPVTDGPLPAASYLLSGFAQAQVSNAPPSSTGNRIVYVTVNGAAVQVLDEAGHFFAPINVRPGENTFTIVATDALEQSTTNSLRLYGTTDPVAFSTLGEVSGSVQPRYGRTSFNAATGILYADLALLNAGTYAIAAPLYVGITRISDPTVSLLAPDGISADGVPYYDFSGTLSGTLGPSDITQSRTLAFHNSDEVQFSFELVILGQPNRGPRFTSAPPVEAIVDKDYHYDFNAIDPDGDSISYLLAIGPTGMTLDSALTRLDFRPTSVHLGNHNIRLLAMDGKGGIAEQEYILSVINQPSNRPPYFTSTALTTAICCSATPYVYHAQAADPDEDVLTFSLVQLPEGMTIDPESGLIEWLPGENDIDSHTIVVQVADAMGAAAQQEFALIVTPDPNNRPPVITSKAIETFEFPEYVGTPEGMPDPRLLDLIVPVGGDFTGTASISLPITNVVAGAADIVFAVDRSGSMGGEHDWIGGMVDALDSELKARGIDPNRYALIGFPFSGVSNDSHIFRITGGSRSVAVYGPDHTRLAGATFSSLPAPLDVALPMDGTYTVVVSGDGHPESIEYNLRFHQGTNPITQLELSRITGGLLTRPSDQHEYTFGLEQGSRIHFDSLTTSPGITWTLVGPSGTVAQSRPFAQSDSSDYSPPLMDLPAGDYVLRVDGIGTAIGEYRFRLVPLDTALPLLSSVPTAGELAPGNETDLYSFTAQTGERVFTSMSALSGGAASGRWSLVGPNGNVAAFATLGGNIEVGPLAIGGIYTLLLEGRVSEPEPQSYILNLEVLPPEQPLPMSLGQTVAGTIDVAGKQVPYTFQLSERSNYYFDALNGTNTLTWTLEGPAGIVVDQRRFTESDALGIANPVLDLIPGEYRLTVDGVLDTTSSYGFRFLNMADAQPIVSGTVVNGELDPANETEMYQFNTVAGERFAFDTLSKENLPNARWRLIGPHGGTFFNTGLGTDVPTLTMWQNGRYTLLVEGGLQDTAPGTYALTLIPTNSVVIPPLVGQPLVLGHVVSNAPLSNDQVDHYRFDLAERSLLYFDALTNSSSLIWTLQGPAGTNVLARRFDQTDSAGNNAPVLDLVAGEYQLSINATGTDSEGYAFRLSRLVDATVLTPGTPVTGQFTHPNETDIYRFSIAPGQRVYAEMRSLSGGGTSSPWRLIDPLGRVIAGQNLAIDLVTEPLMLRGEYALLLEGWIAEASSRDYDFIVQLPTIVPRSLTLGQTAQDTIQSAGERHLYNLNLSERTFLYFDSLVPESSITWSLEGPGSSVVLDARFDQSDSTDQSRPILDLLPGDYGLTVTGTREAIGDYSFRLIDLAAGQLIDPGSEVIGELNPGNETDVYRFNAGAGDHVYMHQRMLNGGTVNNVWKLINPLGQVIASQRLDTDMEVVALTISGTYTLLLEGRVSESEPVQYNFSVYLPQENERTFVLGEAVTGEIALPGERHTYTLSVDRRMHVYLDSSASSDLIRFTLSGPSGTLGDRSLNVDSAAQTLPFIDLLPGDYVLTVDGSGDSVGVYTFRLLNPEVSPLISPGTAVVGELSPGNETDIYRFAAGAGQRVFASMQSLGAGTALSFWRMLDPFGAVVSTQVLGDAIETGPVKVGGTYTLLLEGRVTETEDRAYNFTVQLHAPDQAQSLAFGDPIIGDLNFPGRTVIYSFEVTSRSKWYFDSLTDNGNLRWTLEGPFGTVVDQRRFNQSDAVDIANPVLDLIPGEYRLTVDAVLDTTSSYGFQFLNLADAQPIVPGTVINGELNPANETEMYQFNTVAGERFAFDTLSKENLPNARWRLIGPHGSTFFNTWLGSDVATLTMWQPGRYTLLVEGGRQDTAPGTYALTLISTNSVVIPPLVGQPLALGQVVSNALLSIDQVDHYRFDLSERSLLYFDALTDSSSLIWTLQGPAGTNVLARRFDQSDSADNNAPVLDLVAGEYQLSIDATGTDIQSYAFRLSQLADATVLTPGTPVTGQLTQPNETDIYRFSIASGQRLYAEMLSLSGTGASSRWRLADPLGRIVVAQYLNFDFETEPLLLGGEYFLLVEGWRGETITSDYNLNVELLTDANQQLAIGQRIQGSIRVAGERDHYTFSLPERTLIYFDSHTPDIFFNWTLEGPSGVLVNRRHFAAAEPRNELPTLDLPQGNYLLVVDGSDNHTGPYSFRINSLQPTSVGPDGGVLSGTLSSGNHDDVYTFTGTAGERLDLSLGDGPPFGSADLFRATTRLLPGGGSVEDGYDAIARALRELPFRPEAALNIILVTDEDRDVVNPSLTLQSLINEARAQNVRINTVLDGLINDASGNSAIGLDVDLNAFVADGEGGFIQSPNGKFIGAAGNDDTAENPLAEYVPLAWQTGGATWDLNQLRAGGDTGLSFTKAFVEVNADSIQRQFQLDLRASDSTVGFTNLTGPMDGIGSGETVGFTFRLIRSGGANSFMLEFFRPGTDEIIGSIPVRFRTDYSYQLTALDPDGDPLSYSLVQGPEGASVDPLTGLLRWRPQTNDTTPFILRVQDGRGGIAYQEFAVHPSTTNRQPEITSVPVTVAETGRAYALKILALDPDGDRLYYELEQGPNGMDLDADTGELRWLPQHNQLGSHSVTVNVADLRGGVAEQSWEVEVRENVINASPVVNSVPSDVALVGRNYEYQVDAVDANADPLSFDLPLAPPGLSISTNGLVLWVPRLSQLGAHDVIIRVRDPFGGTALQPFQVRVINENTPPVITSQPIQSATVNLPYRVLVRAQDAENQPLTFRLGSGAPVGLALNSMSGSTNSATLEWIPNSAQVGAHPVEIIVQDSEGAEARQAFEIQVVLTAQNSAPSFTSLPRTRATIGFPYLYSANAIDPDGDPLSFLLLDGPDGMSFDATSSGNFNSGVLRWTADQMGEFSVSISVSDGRPGGTVIQDFTVTVLSSHENDPPLIVSTPPSNATVHEPYAYDLSAQDPDGDPVTWRLVVGPLGMSLDPNSGAMRWTPHLEQLGTNGVVVEAMDAFLATSSQEFVIEVGLVNRPPRITSVPPTEAQTGDPYLYAARASDPDGDTLAWSLVEGRFPSGMSIDGSGGLVRWTPSSTQVGSHLVEISVHDGRGGTAKQSITVVAADFRANHPPVVVSSPQRGATLGRPYSYVFRATDSDGDLLTLESLLPLPVGASFNIVSSSAGLAEGILEWTPRNTQQGSHEFGFVARDAASASGSQRFFVTVKANDSPTIASTPVTNTAALARYRYEVVAIDPEGDPLTYALIQAPPGMTVDALGRIEWTPTLEQTGLTPVSLMVSDGFGGSAMQTFDLSVVTDTTPPKIALELVQGFIGSSGRWAGNLGSTVGFRVAATDDLGIDTLTLRVGNQQLALNRIGDAAFGTHEVTAVGTFEVVATATDLVGNTASVEVDILFTDPNGESNLAIQVHNPEYDATITAPVDIIATITNDTPVLSISWGYALLSDVDPNAVSITDPDFTVVGTSNLPPNTLSLANAVIGRFDPTILNNDIYVIAVAATDSTGITTTEPVAVSVQGNLKFGEFRLEFTDLAIPVAGTPITIRRIYDSRDSRRVGDFGYGWSLGVQDAFIRESVPPGRSFRPNTRVYLTGPDGRRLGFTFAPTLVSASLLGGIFNPRFEPDPGIFEQLEVQNVNFSFRGAGIIGGLLEDLSPYNPDTYFLTTRDGTRYTYTENSGLEDLVDLNGNRLEFTPDGIFHYSATSSTPDQSVQFERDAQGRITQIIDPDGNALHYHYDSRGDLALFTDLAANVTSYFYDTRPAHFLTNIVDFLGRNALTAEFEPGGRLKAIYDVNGNPISQEFDVDARTATYTDGNGNTIRAAYDANGNETMRAVEGVYTNRFAYDANNNLLGSTNGLGFSTNYTYDARGNVTSITDPLTNTTYVSYNEFNKPGAVTNALGQTLHLSYDTTGELTQVINNLGISTTAVRDGAGRVTSLTDATGTNTTIFDYADGCACGQPGTIINPDGSFRSYGYTSQGLTNRVVNELGAETLFHHDEAGRLEWIRDPLTNYTHFYYNGPLLTNVVDALGRSTRYEYDEFNRTNKIIDAEGGVIHFRYDNNGNRTHVIDPVTNITTFIYDAADRLTMQIDPLGHTNFFDYDAAGNRVEAIDRNGRRRTFSYDAANRMTNELWWEGSTVVHSINFTFNELGVQTFAGDASAAYTYSYDDLNRLKEVIAQSDGVPDFTLHYTYTVLDQVESVTDNWGVRVGSGYDKRNRLATRNWQGPGVDPARVDFDYDVAGSRIRTDRYVDLAGANRIGFTTNAYNHAGIVTNITHLGPASDVLAKYDYEFDAAYQIRNWTINNELSAFDYDRTGQLTNALNTTQPDENFRYDENGNRVGAQSGGSYVVGKDNQILSDGTNDYGYDEEGNMTSRSNTVTGVVTIYQFDHRNRLTTVLDHDPAGVVTQTVAFAYDAMNRRLSKMVSVPRSTNVVRFLYNQDDSWADLDGSNAVIARYLHGARIDELLARSRATDGRSWYLTDHLGTVRDIVNAAGAAAAHVEYGVFGQVLSANSPGVADRFLFTGRELDGETGLYFYRARYYAPTLGRFISVDPISFSSGDLNLYRYANNSPLLFADPTGTMTFEYSFAQTIIKVAWGGITAAALDIACHLLLGGETFRVYDYTITSVVGYTVTTYTADIKTLIKASIGFVAILVIYKAIRCWLSSPE